jgi:arylsulfatase A-like enzyme
LLSSEERISSMNAIVLTFDRLPVGFLSCYGNSWIATPNFDRLASQSTLFDQHFAESPGSDAECAAWWSGRYGWRQNNQSDGFSLPEFLSDHGITFRLLVETNGSPVVRPGNRFPIDIAELVRGDDGLDVEPDATPFFRLVARAQRDLRLLRTSRREPWLLWLKSRGIPIPWLAPRSFAARFLDLADDQEADEAEVDQVNGDEVPDDQGAVVEMSGEQFDDLLRAVAQPPDSREPRDALSSIDRGLMRKVCGGYVALLDAALGRLVEQIDHEAASSPTLLIVAAGQGLSVREPGKLTTDWELAGEETVHTPLFVRSPSLSHSTRRQEFVQTVDLVPTLAEWFGIDGTALTLDGKSLLPLIRGEQVGPRPSAIVVAGPKLSGIRTSDFYLVSHQGEDTHDVERRLFAKPDDIWDVNDIAAQSPEVVDQLARQLSETLHDDEKHIA